MFSIQVQVDRSFPSVRRRLIFSSNQVQVDHVFQPGVYKAQAEVALPLPSQPGTQGSSQYHAQVMIADLRTQIYVVLNILNIVNTVLRLLLYGDTARFSFVILDTVRRCLPSWTVNTVHSRLCYILFSVLSLW